MYKSANVKNSSIASKYGITTKQNMGTSGLGLNPNLNIQDEYVENLMKQIHFMNIQVKLLKEKQCQSQNNSLWGIINRTNEPLIKNIVDSSQKYQDMKRTIDSQFQNLSTDNIRLADEQNAILKEYQYLQAKSVQVEKKKNIIKQNFQEKSQKIKAKLWEFQDRLKLINIDKDAQKKKNTSLANQLQTIICQQEKERSRNQYELLKIRNDEIIEQIMQKEKIEAVEALKNKINDLKEKFQSNQDYQRAQEEQIHLRQRIVNLDKNISGANFELMQLNESIKMADIQRQKQIKERKKLTEQFESVKTMLMEILFMNLGRKHKQTENRKRDSAEIQKAEYQTKKLEKNLEEIKKKLQKSQVTQNQLRVQIQGLERQLGRLKSQRQQLSKQLTQMLKQNQQQDKILIAFTNQIRRSEDIYQKVSNEQYILTCQITQLERQIQYLRGRKDYLCDTLNLKDIMNEMKLEDLQRVVQKNNDVNETVSMLMRKWDQIKSFSRM